MHIDIPPYITKRPVMKKKDYMNTAMSAVRPYSIDIEKGLSDDRYLKSLRSIEILVKASEFLDGTTQKLISASNMMIVSLKKLEKNGEKSRNRFANKIGDILKNNSPEKAEQKLIKFINKSNEYIENTPLYK